jgi:hypothetical protein
MSNILSLGDFSGTLQKSFVEYDILDALVKARQGLVLQVTTDKNGHSVRRWVQTQKDVKDAHGSTHDTKASERALSALKKYYPEKPSHEDFERANFNILKKDNQRAWVQRGDGTIISYYTADGIALKRVDKRIANLKQESGASSAEKPKVVAPKKVVEQSKAVKPEKTTAPDMQSDIDEARKTLKALTKVYDKEPSYEDFLRARSNLLLSPNKDRRWLGSTKRQYKGVELLEDYNSLNSDYDENLKKLKGYLERLEAGKDPEQEVPKVTKQLSAEEEAFTDNRYKEVIEDELKRNKEVLAAITKEYKKPTPGDFHAAQNNWLYGPNNSVWEIDEYDRIRYYKPDEPIYYEGDDPEFDGSVGREAIKWTRINAEYGIEQNEKELKDFYGKRKREREEAAAESKRVSEQAGKPLFPGAPIPPNSKASHLEKEMYLRKMLRFTYKEEPPKALFENIGVDYLRGEKDGEKGFWTSHEYESRTSYKKFRTDVEFKGKYSEHLEEEYKKQVVQREADLAQGYGDIDLLGP